MKNNTYLTYRIGEWLFASDSSEVRRILDLGYLKSLNIKQSNTDQENGTVILKFTQDLYGAERKQNGCLLILETNDSTNQKVGLIVNKIDKLVDEEELSYIEKPLVGTLHDDYFVEKYAMIDNELIGIINVNRIMKKNYERVFCQFSSNQYKHSY